MVSLDWTEPLSDEPSRTDVWTLEKLADWKRALSVRANHHRQRTAPNAQELLDMARIWDLLDLADRKQREREGRVGPGPRPQWVHDAIANAR